MTERHHSAPIGVWKELGGGVRRRIRSYGGDIMAVEVGFDRGGVGAPHRHPHRQLTYCLAGAFRFTVEGRDTDLRQGDTIFFPENSLHGCVALEPGVLLDVFTPLRQDFLEADGLLNL
ncbi:MAG: cupin domain-containing protein [Oscillospiraceae bacterium]|jgi:quercetin dioxygenase-like cupin family protein|nr:cupin domain-containing protein [Oscillospiraceae bacterium]